MKENTKGKLYKINKTASHPTCNVRLYIYAGIKNDRSPRSILRDPNVHLLEWNGFGEKLFTPLSCFLIDMKDSYGFIQWVFKNMSHRLYGKHFLKWANSFRVKYCHIQQTLCMHLAWSIFVFLVKKELECRKYQIPCKHER